MSCYHEGASLGAERPCAEETGWMQEKINSTCSDSACSLCLFVSSLEVKA